MLQWEKPNGMKQKRGKKLKRGFDALLLSTDSPEVHSPKPGATFCLHNIPSVFLRQQCLF